MCSSDLLRLIECDASARNFGAIATARIGFVTGANNHFIRNQRDLAKLNIPSEFRVPVVSRTTWLSGLEFTLDDHRAIVDANRRALLVRPSAALVDHERARGWIEEGEAQGVHERFKCTQRSPWFRVDLPPAPDAFASCTRLGSPLLVLNRGGYRCTNALYSVTWKTDLDIAPEIVEIGRAHV